MLKDKLIKLFIVLAFVLTGMVVPCIATALVPFEGGGVAVPPSAPVSATSIDSKNPSGGFSLQTMKSKIDEVINP